MKNRNIPYYVAALMLAAGVSTSFVSCVDTDEPSSIEELRKAKANEVNANAAKLNAEAANQISETEIAKLAAELDRKATELSNAEKALSNAEAELRYESAKLAAELDRKATELSNAEKALSNAEAELRYESAKLAAEIENAKTNATKEADIEKAKLEAENALEVYKVQKEQEIAQAKIEVEAKKLELEKTLADNKLELAKLELTNANDLLDEQIKAEKKAVELKYDKATFDAYGKGGELRQAWLNLQDAKEATIQATKDLADAIEGYDLISLQEDVNTDQKVVDLKKAAKDKFTKLIEAKNYDAFVEEYNTYKAKVDAAEAQQKENDAKIAKLQKEINILSTDKQKALYEITKKITALAEDAEEKAKAYKEIADEFQKELDAFKQTQLTAEKVAFKCENEILVDIIKNGDLDYSFYNDYMEENTNGTFIYNAETKSFIPTTEIEQEDIETVVNNLRNAANFGNKDVLTTNETVLGTRLYKAVHDKLTSDAADLEREITTATTGLQAKWAAAVNAYLTNTDKTKEATLKATMETAINNLFGREVWEYGDYDHDNDPATDDIYGYHFTNRYSFPNGLDFSAFVNPNLFDNDQLLGYDPYDFYSNLPINQMESKYGRWVKAKKAIETDKETIQAVFDAAKKLVADIDKVVDDYETELEAKEAKVNNAKSTEEGIAAFNAWKEAVDALKAEQAKYEDVEKECNDKIADKSTEINDFNNSICDFTTEYYNNQDMRDLYQGFIEYVAGKELQAEDYDVYYAFAVKQLDIDIARAEKVLADDQKKIDDYKAGKYDKIQSITDAQKDLKEAQQAEAEAQEEYDLMAKVYGVTEE